MKDAPITGVGWLIGELPMETSCASTKVYFGCLIA